MIPWLDGSVQSTDSDRVAIRRILFYFSSMIFCRPCRFVHIIYIRDFRRCTLPATQRWGVRIIWLAVTTISLTSQPRTSKWYVCDLINFLYGRVTLYEASLMTRLSLCYFYLRSLNSRRQLNFIMELDANTEEKHESGATDVSLRCAHTIPTFLRKLRVS